MLELDGRVIDDEPDARARRCAGENTRPGFRLRVTRSRLGARRASLRTHRGKSLSGTTLASNVSFGARDYDATVGRWMAKDPARFKNRETSSFAYAADDPVNRFDPQGRVAQAVVVPIAETALAVALVAAGLWITWEMVTDPDNTCFASYQGCLFKNQTKKDEPPESGGVCEFGTEAGPKPNYTIEVMPDDVSACQKCLAVCEKVGLWPFWMPKC